MTQRRPEGKHLSAAAEALAPLDTPRLSAGMVVVHFDPEPTGTPSFRRSVALGPEIVDPRTHDRWAPVMQPDQTRDLIPSMLIVTIVHRR